MHIFSGNPPDINKPLAGDWDNGGIDTTGIHNYTTANFSLDSGLNISFGISGDIPITGGWNGNGYDTIGVFRPSTTQFFFDYDNDGVSDMNATFGVIGDIPVVGDWGGDGDDNIGVFRQNHSGTGLTRFFLDFDNSGGAADQSVAFDEPDDLPVIGDWDGDGDDNIGLYRPGSSTGVFYLDIDNDGGAADIVTPEYGDFGDIPIAGDWDGDSDDNIGVYRPDTGEFFLDATVPDVLPSKTIYVDDDFSDDPSEHRWDTIQEGVDDAADGDTVIVYAGEYVENVDVNKSITLRGEGAEVVTVRAASVYDPALEVTAGWVSILGFVVTGVTGEGGAGIYLDSVNHCNISDNIVSGNYHGVSPDDSSNNTLYNNTASNNNVGGIVLYGLSNNTHTNNTFSNDGFAVGEDSCRNIVENNTVNGKPLAYLEDISNFVIQNTGQVVLVNCTDITVENLNLSNTCVGIELLKTDDCKIVNNIISNNQCYGIVMGWSNNNTLTSNNASDNYYGIYLSSSSDNTLHHNNLAGNIHHNAYDTCTNQWDSGSEGNYYSDYNGTNPGGDGIGKDPYLIPGGGGSIDRFPLMQPWTPQQLGDLNGDNRITPADAAIALAFAAGGGSASCDAATLDAADVSGDGRVTSLDALMIRQGCG